MMATIAPFWDGNETWLVVIGAALFAAFPVVYAVFLPAFYLPVLLLLLGLIFRGVAFEFRHAAGAAAAVGPRLLPRLGWWRPSCREQPSGDDPRHPSSMAAMPAAHSVGHAVPVLCGLGLVLGYALLGAGWLVLKTEDDLRDWARRRIPLAGRCRAGRAGPGLPRHLGSTRP